MATCRLRAMLWDDRENKPPSLAMRRCHAVNISWGILVCFRATNEKRRWDRHSPSSKIGDTMHSFERVSIEVSVQTLCVCVKIPCECHLPSAVDLRVGSSSVTPRKLEHPLFLVNGINVRWSPQHSSYTIWTSTRYRPKKWGGDASTD